MRESRGSVSTELDELSDELLNLVEEVLPRVFRDTNIRRDTDVLNLFRTTPGVQCQYHNWDGTRTTTTHYTCGST